MGRNAPFPRQAPPRSGKPWRLTGWGAFLLLLLLAASALPLLHTPGGSALGGPGAGSSGALPSGAATEGPAVFILSSGARASLPAPAELGTPTPVPLLQGLGEIGLGALAAVGFSLRFRKKKEEGTAPPRSPGQSAPGPSQPRTTGGNAPSPAGPGYPSKNGGGAPAPSEAAAAPPLPEVSLNPSRAPSGSGPTPLVVPVDQAVCPLCGGALSAPNAPCPTCTPSLVPGPVSAPGGDGSLPGPGPASPPLEVPHPGPGDGRKDIPPVLPPSPSPATARCMVCGGPLKEGYCPVCGMRWSD